MDSSCCNLEADPVVATTYLAAPTKSALFWFWEFYEEFIDIGACISWALEM